MPRKPEELSNGTEKAWDLGDWHNDPSCNVEFLPNPGNGGLYIVCTTHRVASDVEAIGARITHTASKKGG